MSALQSPPHPTLSPTFVGARAFMRFTLAPFRGRGQGEGASPRTPPLKCFSKPLRSNGSSPPKSSCFVPYLGLFSQNAPKPSRHRLPARRAPRGGFARAAEASGPKAEGEGGGYPPIFEKQLSCRSDGKAPPRRAARQPQCAQAWPAHRPDEDASGHPAACPAQAAPSLRRDRRHDQAGRRSRRAHARAARDRADRRGLERGISLHEGGAR